MHSSTKKKAYCYLVSNEGRDFYLLVAFIYYLERYEHYTVSLEFAWNAHKIRTSPPDLVILPNVRGHSLYYEIAQYAADSGILVFASDSEGNFNTDVPYDFWGYNTSKNPFSPLMLVWNERVRQFLLQDYSFLSPDRIKVSGAPGFDKYTYLPRTDRKTLLAQHGIKPYDRVVGYAGWAFGKLDTTEIDGVLELLQMPGEKGKQWFREQREAVERCLRTAIEAFPDTLFILKKHPRENFESDHRDSLNEMNRLKDYPNVWYLKDEEDIQNLIQISDLWMAFESTSIMEAWLLDVPTLKINTAPDFKWADLYKGTASVQNPAELLNVLEQFFRQNNPGIVTPPNVLEQRQAVIANSIGYADGYNHLRCALHFRPFLSATTKPAKKTKFHAKFFRLYLLLHVGKCFYIPWLFKRLPKFRKTVWVFENYTLSRIGRERQNVYEHLDTFYQKERLPEKITSGEIWSELE